MRDTRLTVGGRASFVSDDSGETGPQTWNVGAVWDLGVYGPHG
jgi:hypothetical protein